MGVAKRAHIAALMALPRVAAAWAQRHGRAPSEADIDAVYAAFAPKNFAVAARHATLIPGVAEVVAELRLRGRQDRLDDGLYKRDHGGDPAGRRADMRIVNNAGQRGRPPDDPSCRASRLRR